MTRHNRRQSRVICCLFTVLISHAIAATKPATQDQLAGVYRGILNGQEIVLEIGPEPPDPDTERFPLRHYWGRYFYRDRGIAIGLEGFRSSSDGALYLQERDTSGDLLASDTDYKGGHIGWRLSFSVETASGFMCKCQLTATAPAQERQSVELTRVSSGFDPGLRWRKHARHRDQAYYDLLLDYPLSREKDIRVSDQIAYAMLIDARLRVGMPQLVRFPDAGVMAKVNQDLRQKLNEARLAAHDCRWNEVMSIDGYEEQHERVSTISRDILKIEMEIDPSCGGDFKTQEPDKLEVRKLALIYNLKTGTLASHQH